MSDMDNAFATTLTEAMSVHASPPQQPADIDALASHAVDSLYAAQQQPHAASVDDQAVLSQQYSELMAQNELLAKENRLFDSFLQRNAAAAIEHDKSPKHGRRDKNRQQLELTLSDVRPHTSTASHQPSTQTRTCAEPLPLCAPCAVFQLDRNRLAVDELAYRSRQLSSLQQKSTSDLALLRSISLNMQLRQQELKKQAFEFQREVVMHKQQHATSNGRHTETAAAHLDTTGDSPNIDAGSSVRHGSGDGRGVASEVLLRFLNDQIRDKQGLIKKLGMKIRHQKAALRHMQQQLKQKEEQGDSLHSIDFHQLQIKNSQYNSRIKDKNEQLLALKSGAGTAVNRLNAIKKTLSHEAADNKHIRRSIKLKHELTQRMASELHKVEAEIRAESAKQGRLKQVQANPDMPHVMDYVRQKMELQQLTELDSNWDRKIEIAQMTHVPPNSVRVRQQRQQRVLQTSGRREQEGKEQWRALSVAAGGMGAVSSNMSQ